ncbi:PEPxxWA-CTERM sorting domain-containing protein [Sandarakinorhabdus limnophila]|uniref:PEPxxWA-CTERM sorting domain-containing protein n=1 Tax=Sandarakinorhabdus limnophila TaxID=210512 RepID=UPI0026E9618B|nr:PEPxxWA-CTERM sorting domain-containing protein [Sandarakinorhabdus limnophila]
MRTVSIMLAMAAFSLTAAPAAAVTQFAGNGHLYEFVATNRSWQGALAAAAAAAATPIAGYTAHLVTITSQAEDDFLKTLTGSATFVWAAGTDEDVEGTWKWAAGPEAGQTFFIFGTGSVGFFNWNAGEPNNVGTEDYLHFKANAGNWNDIFSTFPSGGYVVEYSLNSGAVPEPASWAMLLGGLGVVGTALRRRGSRKTVAA